MLLVFFIYIYILSTLLFLYGALRAHVRCKRLINTSLHYITYSIARRTACKRRLLNFPRMRTRRPTRNLPQIPWQWHREQQPLGESKRHRGRLRGMVQQRGGVSHRGAQLLGQQLLPSKQDCPGRPCECLDYWG